MTSRPKSRDKCLHEAWLVSVVVSNKLPKKRGAVRAEVFVDKRCEACGMKSANLTVGDVLFDRRIERPAP